MLAGSLAQQIARDTSDVIGYNVLITDDAGIVIGSGDIGRLGSFHEASVEVLRSRQAAWHTAAEAAELRGVKPGMTLPILIDGEAVGTVGITGSPRQVRRFGLVVRRQTEILLQESLELRSRLLRERALEELVRDIGSFDPDVLDPEFLVGRAAELGYDLTVPRTVLLVDVDEPMPELLRTLRDALGPKALVATMTSGRLAALPVTKGRSPSQLATATANAVARRNDLRCRVAVGGTGVGAAALHDAYADAADALRLGPRIDPGGTTYLIDELRGHQVMAAVGLRARSRLMTSVAGSLVAQPDWPDLRRTLIAWCESGFNLVRTAEALHIHRNTLIYRLQKIERLTGTPWRNHRANLTLYLACLANQLD
ncbi:carbohydrate diacid regulator [Kribbella sp. VKM Ac-2527]|uniref:Carbohydrate diacid regulator n=1 Tax=Kribbella caucasensis TaxID=2512215 RepID=A0A4R6K9A7_9ACTN|nr:sugar diacid recognition domain-containing protein [Kribbella sp. VKM Ac-2527]TDO45757.1 carbohydrate diacid regulator [Kribbella sp. VKM Ac-2527]